MNRTPTEIELHNDALPTVPNARRKVFDVMHVLLTDLRPLVERFEAVAVWMEELKSSFKVWSAINMCDQPSSVALSDTTRYILPFLLDIGTGSLGYEKCLWKMSQLMQ